MTNLSIPSIPSRYLTPVLKFDLQEKELPASTKIGPQASKRQELITESILVTRVSKLTHDGSNVGPGDYEVERAHKANKP